MKKSLAFLSGICLALSSGLASAVMLNGWNVGNPTPVGAAGLVNATKNVGGVAKVSNASIVPNASQVSKILRGGVAGVALTVAVNELLDGIDWVMDPANNQIRYNEKKLYEGYSFYNPNNVNDADDEGFATPYLAAKNYYTYWCNQGNSNYCGNYTFTCPTEISSSIRCTLDQDNSRGITLFPKKNSAEFEEKTLPLDTVSQKVIDKAEVGNTDAQEATVAAAQDILNEAQNDAEKAKPIVQQLENNSTDLNPPALLSKGRKQNIDNEYVRSVQNKENGDEDPCEWLKNLRNSEPDKAIKKKIKTAEKRFNCDGKNRFDKN